MTKRFGWLAIPLALFCSAPLFGQCDPGNGIGGTGSDVIVGDITSPNSYGSSGGVFAYSVGTTSCNIGTVNLNWFGSNNNHPVIGQNLYRILNGRFEHIGNSWLKQGFAALQGSLCENDAPPGQPDCDCSPSGSGSLLGVGCSDPYGAGLNGSQGNLSARSEVLAVHRGWFQYPPILDPSNSNLTTRRLRVSASDLNTGGTYVVEAHYVTPDDAVAGNAYNNCSHRLCSFGGSGNRNMNYLGATQRQLPAIQVWENMGATLEEVFTGESVTNPGRVIVGHNVVDNGNGTWTYNYTVYNQNSTRGVNSFEVPLPSGITLSDVGFNGMDYHSNDPVQDVDWSSTQSASSIRWDMVPVGGNINYHNYVRWGSAYSFWFTTNAGPTTATGTIDLYLSQDPQNGATFSGADFRTVTLEAPDGTFVTPPQGLACNVAGFDVNLSWTNGETYTAIEVSRNGSVIATLGGGATSYTDTGVAAGSYTYGVNGIATTGESGDVSCGADVEIPAVSGLICNGGVQSATLSWINNASYTGIEVRRDGFLIATIAGTATSFNDSSVPAGPHTYVVTAFLGGADADDAVCNATVLDPPPLAFTFTAENVTATYDEATGVGNFEAGVSLLEDSGNPGFPNDTAGFSVALGSNSTFLTPTSLDLATPISSMNGGTGPEFVQTVVEADGVSAGIIFDFQAVVTLEASTSQDLVVAAYDINAATLAGNGVGALTTLDFVDFTLGQNVENVVVVGVDSINPIFSDALIDLQPIAGGLFKRGDCNSDGSTDIADAVSALSFLFPSGAPPTLACESACDGNNDGSLNIADAVRILDALFGMPANPLPAPTGACGADPTPDTLTCDNYTGC